MQSIFYKNYLGKVVPALQEKFGFSNTFQVPRITKVTVNVGYGRHVKDAAYKENVEKTITRITGQKPVHNAAKKSISNFKIREGMPIGVSVTLRGNTMHEFLYRLVHLVLPRVRDFRGLDSKSFDRQGNYTIGLKENIAFPEISTDAVDQIHGIEITIATTAKNPEQGLALLTDVGFPFKKL